jgi:adenine-specific DNA-methyltransferase
MVKNKPQKKPVEQYDHKDKERINNPPVGLVTSETDKETGKKTYSYDPHLDPQLQWAGKAEHTSFEVPTISLHVHERIDPITIIDAVRKRNGKKTVQLSLFESAEENPPLREAIEFYKHKHNWSNRLIAGDSLLVMNSLLEKEGMAGKVQMIYIDPPYGIKYGSNFQPFVNKRDVKDGKDEDLTQEPEMIKAFRDTWELGIHSYLTYLRDRLLLARELLTESGSVFVQIGAENVHLVRCLMDDVFGSSNFVCLIPFRKKAMTLGAKTLENMNDFLVWYARDINAIRYRQLYINDDGTETRWDQVDLSDGTVRATTKSEKKNPFILPLGSKLFNPFPIQAPSYDEKSVYAIDWQGKEYIPPTGTCWITPDKEKLMHLLRVGRLFPYGGSLAYKQYLNDFPYRKLTNRWEDTSVSTI